MTEEAVDSQYENYEDDHDATRCVDECPALRRTAGFLDRALEEYIAEEGKYGECHRGRCAMYVWNKRLVPVAIAWEKRNAQCGDRGDLAGDHLQRRVAVVGEEKCSDCK